MSSGANGQANVLQFAVFRDHGWGHVAVFPSVSTVIPPMYPQRCVPFFKDLLRASPCRQAS